MQPDQISINVPQSLFDLKKGSIYRVVIDDAEKILIIKALENTSGNQFLAARILGVNRNTLRTKIKKYNIITENYKQ